MTHSTTATAAHRPRQSIRKRTAGCSWTRAIKKESPDWKPSQSGLSIRNYEAREHIVLRFGYLKVRPECASQHEKAPARAEYFRRGLAVQELGVSAPEVRFPSAERSSHSGFKRAIALLQR